jgi:hypothetical protein
MKITAETTEDMIEIVYGLVTKGLMFSAVRKNGVWVIELTGGY